ncbi:V-type ATPase 116kDa subunit family protein [Chitinispirillales bacterium ANBcel5]|uniref:V-type ATP synthase subunit I n=1 Tax=Cellulosispirillum alkaliphilum TaxID=3039283 RepID=UPI002A56333F|nr:V-type ATPase 116kDa subunit family protein [Chitinispirillales bacterium ANBcel5]
MIVKMKRMDLLLYHKEREKFLDDLGKLGVVHITEAQESDSPKVQELRGVGHLSVRVIDTLKKIQKEKDLQVDQVKEGDAKEILFRFEELETQKEKIEQDIENLLKDKETLEPWGNFDHQKVNKLKEVGVKIRFYTMSDKLFEQIDRKEYPVEEINRIDSTVYFIAIENGGVIEIPQSEEVHLPALSLKQVEENIAKLVKERKRVEQSIEKMVNRIELLEKFRVDTFNQYQFEKARLSLKREAKGRMLSLSGWFPSDKEKELRNYVNRHPAYVSIRDPKEDEDVPVKLRNRSFPTLFEPILGLYSLPTYNELDLTPFIAPFFAIFFGLCLGDAGYGMVLTVLAIYAGMKVKPKLKPFMKLGVFLGLSTFVSGVLLNTFFGMTIFGGPGIEESALFPVGVQYFAPLSAQVGPAGQVFPAMSLALVVGAVQLLFGIGLQSYMKIKYSGIAAGLQPISTILIMLGAFVWSAHADLLGLGIGEFTVGPVEMGAFLISVPQRVGQGLTIFGLIGILLFNNIEKKFILRPLTGLWELYNLITGTLQNLLSYLRLFALGLAGGLLGGAFNQIAFLFITDNGEINYASWGLIATILVLVFGHGLNLALSAMGAFVHPLRLTFVEFYGAVGYKGGSKPFIPFAKVDQ